MTPNPIFDLFNTHGLELPDQPKIEQARRLAIVTGFSLDYSKLILRQDTVSDTTLLNIRISLVMWLSFFGEKAPGIVKVMSENYDDLFMKEKKIPATHFLTGLDQNISHSKLAAFFGLGVEKFSRHKQDGTLGFQRERLGSLMAGLMCVYSDLGDKQSNSLKNYSDLLNNQPETVIQDKNLMQLMDEMGTVLQKSLFGTNAKGNHKDKVLFMLDVISGKRQLRQSDIPSILPVSESYVSKLKKQGKNRNLPKK